MLMPFEVFAVTASSISIDLVPENPEPNENVTITLSSYASNLDLIPISWSVNGKTAASGRGKKSFSVVAPAEGKEVNVTASISLPDGLVEKKVMIRPEVMVLLWQANDSYVPPFYKGKALPTLDSEIKVVAMPETKGTNRGNLAYSWKKDYASDQSASGYNKNFYIYQQEIQLFRRLHN